MSLKQVQREIDRFLRSSEPEVMAIKGDWGSGKTHTWNRLVREASKDKQIALKRYSYVSLFGAESLDSLKTAIFQYSTGTDAIDSEIGFDMVKSNTDQLAERLGRRSISLFKLFDTSGRLFPTIQALAFASLRGVLVCLDDFERCPESLPLKQVLGLIANLKDERNCKVALILNEDYLARVGKNDYKEFREKVVDVELDFRPTHKECSQIAITGSARYLDFVRESCSRLEIRNIRVLRRIARASETIQKVLSGFDEALLKDAVNTVALMSHAYYSRPEGFPSFEFIEKLAYSFRMPGDEPIESEGEQAEAWREQLDAFGYKFSSELDKEIGRTIVSGYANEERLRELAQSVQDGILMDRSHATIVQAWKNVLDSVEDDESEVVESLLKEVRENARRITPGEIDQVLSLLRKLDRGAQAEELIAFYLDARDRFASYDLSTYPASTGIKDVSLFRVLNELELERVKIESPGELLSRLMVENTWSEDDIGAIARLSPDDLLAILRGRRGQSVHATIRKCLGFGQFQSQNPAYFKIATNMAETIESLIKTSRLNKIRFEQYSGVIDQVKRRIREAPPL